MNNNASLPNMMFQQKLKPLFSSILKGKFYPTKLPYYQSSTDWQLTDLYGSDTTYIKQLINDELVREKLTDNSINYYKEINDIISDPNRINWTHLSANPSTQAINLLSKNPDKIEWRKLIRENTNHRVWELMENFPEHMEKYADVDKDNFQKYLNNYISQRHEDKAIEYLLKYFPNDINFKTLSSNSSDKAIDLLAANPTKIHWDRLSRNPNDKAIDLLISNPSNISYADLRYNTNFRAFNLLVFNKDRINWRIISQNESDWAIDLLHEEPQKIDWYYLCKNKHPDVVDLFIEHKEWFDKYVARNRWNEYANPNAYPAEEIYYFNRYESQLLKDLLYRPEIFEFDYEHAVREKHINSGLFAELLANRFHPRNIPKFFGWGFEDFHHYAE